MCERGFDREALTMSDGKLRAFTDIGGYPLFYITKAHDIVCAPCATNEEKIATCGVHWEGEPIVCDECNKEIESAYGVPESEATNGS